MKNNKENKIHKLYLKTIIFKFKPLFVWNNGEKQQRMNYYPKEYFMGKDYPE